MAAHWRDSQKIARFFFLDARVFLVLLVAMLHIRPWTAITATLVVALFWVLERRGLTFEAALRAFRAWILGHNRPATSRLLRRRWIDNGAQ
ncbi:MAG: acetyltransferase [Alphaproteobacteria bacterium]|nr:acetyltransferase [Alphaproteobacteria bacterium]